MTPAPSAVQELEEEEKVDQYGVTTAYPLFMMLAGVNGPMVSGLFYLSLALPVIPPEVRDVLYFADILHGVIFAFDFGVRFKRAPHRLHYLRRWGLLDLLTVVPAVPVPRFLRLPRIVLTEQMLRRRTRAARLATRRHLARNSLLVVLGLVLLVVVYGSATAVIVEARAPGATIDSGGDAIGWAFVTIASVGYGDTYPVTGLGRLVGILMLVAGVSPFSVLTSYVSSTFLGPRRRAARRANTVCVKRLPNSSRSSAALKRGCRCQWTRKTMIRL